MAFCKLQILDHSFEVRSPIGDLQILLQTYLLYLLHICHICCVTAVYGVYLLYLLHICYICCVSAVSDAKLEELRIMSLAELRIVSLTSQHYVL